MLRLQDLKPANLLINDVGRLQIADLGLGRVVCPERPYTHQVATRWYRAPELLYGARHYTGAVDLWAVGCILAELYNKSPLFPVSLVFNVCSGLSIVWFMFIYLFFLIKSSK